MKRLTLLLVLAGVMMLAMNRCLKVENPYDNENNELSIEDAKIFFENFGEKLYLEKENDETATRGGSKRVSPRIMWDRGLEFRQGGKAKVEAPVEVMAAMVVKVKDPVTGEETVRRYLNCSVRIVAEKTPEGEIVYKTACMIGDMKYLSDRIRVLGERDRREGVKKRHLMTMSEMGDFTGKLLWFDTDGNFLNGETWLRGTVSATFDQYGQAFNTTSATRSSYDGSVSQDDPQTVQLAYYYDPCSGGGGGTNPPTDPDPEPICNMCQNPQSQCACPKEEDCDDMAVKNFEKAQITYYKFVNNGLLEFASEYHNADVEYGMDLVRYPDGTYGKTDAFTNGSATELSRTIFNDNTRVTAAIVHNHTTQSGHSHQDIIALASAFMETDQTCNTSFVISSSHDNIQEPAIFALVVEDPAKVAAFFASYQTQDGDIKTTEEKTEEKSTELLEAEQKIIEQLNTGRGYINTADKSMYALAAVLTQYDIGMAILKLDDNGFRQRKSEITFEEGKVKLGKISKCK